MKKSISLDTLYSPNQPKIMDNKINVDGAQYSSKTHLLLVKDKPQYDLDGFQLWSTLSKKKLYDIEFSFQINPFLSTEGSKVLIFEDKKAQIGEVITDDFTLKVLDITTGTIKTDTIVGSGFDGMSGKCYNISSNKNKWLCNSGDAKFWEVDSEFLTVDLVADLSNPDYDNMQNPVFMGIPETDTVLLGLLSVNSATDYKFEGYQIFDFNTGKVKTLSNLDATMEVFPLSKDYLGVKQNSTFSYYDVSKQSKHIVTTVPENTEYLGCHVFGTVADISLKKSNTYADSIHILSYDFKEKNIRNSYKIGWGEGLFKSFEGINYYKYNDAYYTYNDQLKNAVRWNNQKPKYTQPHDLNVNKSGKLLYRGEWLIDLKTLNIEKQLQSFTSNVLLDDNQILRLESVGKEYGSKQHKFQIIDPYQEDLILWESRMLKIDYDEKPRAQVWSNDKNYVLYFNSSNIRDTKKTVYLIDLISRKVHTKTIDYPIGKVKFSESTKQLVISSDEYSPYRDKVDVSQFFSLPDLRLKNTIESAKFGDQVDEDTVLLTGYEYFEYLIRAKISRGKIIKEKTYYAQQTVTTSNYIKSKNILVAGSENGNLFFWNMEESFPFHVEKISDSEIVKITEINNLLYVLSKESEISVVNLETKKLLVSGRFFDKSNEVKSKDDISLAWITPEGYFKASKTDIRNFHFVRNGKALPVVDFEIYLNRPDIIMQRLGFALAEDYELYKNAYLKRLARNGLEEDTDIFNLDRPKLLLSNRTNIPIQLKQEQIQLEFENTSNAEYLDVFVNGVPVVNQSISEQSTIKTKLDLNSGINRISAFTTNKHAIQSEPITFETTNLLENKKPKLYYIGIGVSKYKDSTMDLRYADADAQRISRVFADRFESSAIVKTILNEEVTKEAVQKAKFDLMQTTIDDVVVVSFSGHGLIGENDEFYFATHDIDFSQPEINGISYGNIHNLLTGIPARRKLLLLDACHSGELDTATNNKDLKTNVISSIPEGAKGSKARSTTSNNEESFKLMQSLFFDINRGNGSYVISAAGGAEFAYENDEWRNGVFTYSFINALYNVKSTTLNGVRGVPISKLKDYVYKKVMELTSNNQRPTSRAENLEWDWMLTL
ncbi:caspase family protein [Winogradskyella sp.]